MTTKEKCLAMMHKAAAAKRLGDKIMTKRAEYAERRVQPSDAYTAGFCKAAEDMGVDPGQLVKAAARFIPDARYLKLLLKSIMNSSSYAISRPGSRPSAGPRLTGLMRNIYGDRIPAKTLAQRELRRPWIPSYDVTAINEARRKDLISSLKERLERVNLEQRMLFDRMNNTSGGMPTPSDRAAADGVNEVLDRIRRTSQNRLSRLGYDTYELPAISGPYTPALYTPPPTPPAPAPRFPDDVVW